MSLPDAAAEHYRAQLRQSEATMTLARRQWRRMAIDDLDGSWAGMVRMLTATVAAGQLGAARAGAAYVPLALAEQGHDGPVDGQIAPEQLAGVASDGRPLATLLFAAVVYVRMAMGRGLPPVDALARGSDHLELLVRTQVADAARSAAGVAIAVRPGVGYVRMVSPPCCQRCAVQAGRFFRWNAGFLRHPACRCRHAPQVEGQPVVRSGIRADQIRDLTQAQRHAIADGADMNQVINARRGRSNDGMTTSEGTTRRGLAGQRGVRRRLTPEGIYRVSSTREQAIELLRRNGYLL